MSAGNTTPATAPAAGTMRTLQALRAVAALLVVWNHALDLWSGRFDRALTPFHWPNGQAGVEIFFIISGFIMPVSLRKARRSGLAAALTFLRRRVERILPLYWIATTVKLLLGIFVTVTVPITVTHAVASYLFLPYFHASNILSPVLIVGWTLNLEMLFYTLIALALALRLPVRSAVSVVLILLFFLPAVPFVTWNFLRVSSLPYLPNFILGMLLSVRRERTVHRVPPWLAGIVFVASTVALLLLPQTGSRLLVWSVPAFLMVGTALELEPVIGNRLPRLLLMLGDASYSIYLAHTFVLPALRVLVVHKIWGVQNEWSVVLLSLILGSAAGLVVYRYIESPINNCFHVRRQTAVL